MLLKKNINIQLIMNHNISDVCENDTLSITFEKV